jgi:hypothetical protein
MSMEKVSDTEIDTILNYKGTLHIGDREKVIEVLRSMALELQSLRKLPSDEEISEFLVENDLNYPTTELIVKLILKWLRDRMEGK